MEKLITYVKGAWYIARANITRPFSRAQTNNAEQETQINTDPQRLARILWDYVMCNVVGGVYRVGEDRKVMDGADLFSKIRELDGYYMVFVNDQMTIEELKEKVISAFTGLERDILAANMDPKQSNIGYVQEINGASDDYLTKALQILGNSISTYEVPVPLTQLHYILKIANRQ